MKIVDVKNVITFGDTLYGEMFRYNEQYFMRTKTIDSFTGQFNAVNLDTGEMLFFLEDTTVHVVNGHIEIY